MNEEKIETNLNLGMAAVKSQHCVIQPQIMPNLLDHAQKRDFEVNNASVVIGALLGRVDGKIIDISNCFALSLKTVERKIEVQEGEKKQSEKDYLFDGDYLKKMLKFYRQLNDQEALLGVYISSPTVNPETMVVFSYFRDLFVNGTIKSPLNSPIMLIFDPTLNGNKLSLKILNVHSFYLEECPLFSEVPFKFNLNQIDKSGLDVLFYGQDYLDTLAIMNDNRDLSQEMLTKMQKQQCILQNKQLLLRNIERLTNNLEEIEQYVRAVLENKEAKNSMIASDINACMSKFSGEDLAILEQIILKNYEDAMVSNNLSKLQMAQINLTEKINNLFSQSLNQFLLQQNQRFQTKQDIIKPPEVSTTVTPQPKAQQTKQNKGKK